MKRILTLAAAFGIMLGAAAVDVDELRVYINPGHGSWTANDRPMPIRGHGAYSRYNTDTTSFFESNTNLRKGFGVLEKLRAYGLYYDENANQTGAPAHRLGAALDLDNNIVMSHVKCGPYHDDNGTSTQLGNNTPADISYYNRSLPEICAEVDANYFDMFISIHSNAVDSGGWKTTNFPIILYRGYDNCKSDDGLDSDHSATCKVMAQKVWPYHVANTHEAWTAYSASNPNIRGDIDYYHSSSKSGLGYRGYLGVLKHGAPGFLVEGYFHQYSPAALRHMNWDVDYIEGFNYAHGIADYFGLTKESTGEIYGIVRDANERLIDESYVPIPTHDDAYMPLDNVTVTLKKGTNTVATYTTDNQFNGAFVFYDVEPGDYTLEFAAEGYKSPKPVDVTVKAADVVYPTAFMVSESYVPPTVTYTDYPDELEGTEFGARDEYNFNLTATDKAVPELAGKNIRRVLHVLGKIYVLAYAQNPGDEEETPYIFVIDDNTLEVVATPEIVGMSGTRKNVADIAVTADGVLLASPSTLCHYDDGQVQSGETRGNLTIFRWNNDEETGLPVGACEPWVSTKLSGNFYRAYSGDAIAYTGTSTRGQLLISAFNNSTASSKVFYSVLDIVEGTKMAESIRNASPAYFNWREMGELTLNISPLDATSFIADCPTQPAAQFAIAGVVEQGTLDPSLTNANAVIPGFMRYSGHSMMVIANNDADGKNIGVKLLDITNGLDNATVVYTLDNLEATEGIAATTCRNIAAKDAYGRVESGNIAIYLIRGDGLITRLSTEGVRQPQGRREFAYGITIEETATDTYTLTFKSTGDAPAANVVLTSEALPDDVVRIPVGAVVKGENSVTFDNSDLNQAGAYAVAVEIISKRIPEAGEYFADPTSLTKRGGVVTITDTESDNLGYTAVTVGGANGVKIYAPDGTVTGPFFVGDSRLVASNQSSMFRGDEREGKVVFADWSDGGAGYWVIDPSNPVDMSQLMGGARDGADGSKGSFYYDGKIIGGGSSCVGFQGRGENTKMFTFLEDYPAGNTPGADNKMGRYDIGSAEQITFEPVVFDNLKGNGKLANQNVEVATADNGFFASQCRSEGNNLAGTPCFLYADNDGNIIMQSHELDYITSSSSAIALSADRKLLAVSQYDKITVMTLEWIDGEPVPSLLLNIPTAHSEWAHARFDIANNLHVYLREDGGYHAYSLPGEEPSSLVAAKAEYVVRGNGSGVEDIAIEAAAEEGAETYYNLNGVRVNHENLTPGIYVKVVGGKASKVVVR